MRYVGVIGWIRLVWLAEWMLYVGVVGWMRYIRVVERMR